jgi:hypothetical protein
MKREIISFSVAKPRNFVARDMLNRDGPFKPRVENTQREYRRNDKHRKNYSDYNDRFYR